MLSRRLTAFFSLAYVPWGPELPSGFDGGSRARALGALAARLKAMLPASTLFIRFDPPWAREEGEPAVPLPRPFCRASADIQAPDTVLVDLSADEEAILARMKPKTRYNVRLAEKKVRVVQPDSAGLEAFYALFRETASRDGIAVYGIGYYRALFEECAASADAQLQLYLACHEDDPIAAIITLRCGGTATYLYGASSNRKRNLMAPALLQWRAMLDAKAAGCTSYDLFGIPPDDNPLHPMAGLYRFKTGFGGRIVHRSGSFDYPYNAPGYALFHTAEKLRKTLRDLRKTGGTGVRGQRKTGRPARPAGGEGAHPTETASMKTGL